LNTHKICVCILLDEIELLAPFTMTIQSVLMREYNSIVKIDYMHYKNDNGRDGVVYEIEFKTEADATFFILQNKYAAVA
jgi:hypothetical protein